MITSLKKGKIKFKQMIKLNHNINNQNKIYCWCLSQNAKSVIMVKTYVYINIWNVFMCEGNLKHWQQLTTLWDWWR